MAIYLNKELKVKEELKEINFIPKLNPKKPKVKVGILNLMPTLEETEKDFLRILDNPIVEVELDFLYLDTKNSDHKDYVKRYYKSFQEIKRKFYDGVIVTGAPLEHFKEEHIQYIDELKEFLEYTKTNVRSTIFLCWASQIALHYFYGIDKIFLEEKLSGVYQHYIVHPIDLVKGLDDFFYMPQSRYCSLKEDEILDQENLVLVSKSNEAGAAIIASKDGSQIFITGHGEYNRWTLDQEYQRDKIKGIDVKVPIHYYKNNDPENKPICLWRSSAYLIYHNWLYYYVYNLSKV